MFGGVEGIILDVRGLAIKIMLLCTDILSLTATFQILDNVAVFRQKFYVWENILDDSVNRQT